MALKKIFVVTHNVDAPTVAATPDPDAFFRTVMRDLSALDESAQIPPFQLIDPSAKGYGFYNISNKVLLFDRAVFLGPLGPSLEISGNIHPTTLNDTKDELFFLNVTAIYNCLNIAETVYHRRVGEDVGVDHGLGVKRPAFFPKLIGDSYIFRIPQMKYAVFVASDGSGSDEDFYTLYQSSENRGLIFQELWSDS